MYSCQSNRTTFIYYRDISRSTLQENHVTISKRFLYVMRIFSTQKLYDNIRFIYESNTLEQREHDHPRSWFFERLVKDYFGLFLFFMFFVLIHSFCGFTGKKTQTDRTQYYCDVFVLDNIAKRNRYKNKQMSTAVTYTKSWQLFYSHRLSGRKNIHNTVIECMLGKKTGCAKRGAWKRIRKPY